MRAGRRMERMPSYECARGRTLMGRIRRIVTLGAFMLPGVATSGQHANGLDHRRTTRVESSDRPQAGACVRCHSAVVSEFAGSAHALPAATAHTHTLTCATCHGTQADHVASAGAKSKELDPASGTKTQVDELCLNCHRAKDSAFADSPHGKAGVSCTTCHSIHHPGTPTYLLKAAEHKLCFQCHGDQQPQFTMAFRHNVIEGVIECSDCHDSHGTMTKRRPESAFRQRGFCTNCHTETSGPFVFEHAIMKAEGCTACHVPHGGPNPHLLIGADPDAICRQCHVPSPDPAVGAHMPSAKDHSGRSKSCVDCHTDIHGSSRSPALLTSD